jgi:hypothetical protein
MGSSDVAVHIVLKRRFEPKAPFFRHAYWRNGMYLLFQLTSIHHLSMTGVNVFAADDVLRSGPIFKRNLDRRHNKILERMFRGKRISSKLSKMPGLSIFGNTGLLVGLLGYTGLPSTIACNSDGFPCILATTKLNQGAVSDLNSLQASKAD